MSHRPSRAPVIFSVTERVVHTDDVAPEAGAVMLADRSGIVDMFSAGALLKPRNVNSAARVAIGSPRPSAPATTA